MFNGIPDQFYQFIDSRTPLTLPLPLSLPLHVSPPNCFSGLDHPPPSHPHHQQQQQQFIFQSQHPLFHYQLHRQSPTVEDEEEEEEQEEEREAAVGRSMELLGLNLKPSSQIADPWTEEEILALWRIRSSIQSGFTDFVWEHVSRKLAELGFKRNAEKCKEKYEEVSKYCNTTTTTTYSKNSRSFNELEALYEGVNPNHSAEKVVMSEEGGAKMKIDSEENSGNETLVNPPVEKECETRNSRMKKRKRDHKLKMLKSFCEEIVNKIMVQQEELQNKLLEDMERREEEKIAREEAWRKQEMARMDREIELRARLQEIASDREATIIQILKNLNPNPSLNPSQNPKLPISSAKTLVPQNPSYLPTQINPADAPSSSTVSLNNTKVPSSSSTQENPAAQNPNSLATQENPAPQNPNSLATLENPAAQNPNYTSSTDREDHGKRWPRNEVYSLINLRCSLYSSGEDKEGSKVPLWERISLGMMDLGYNRSAKRCKEKWENINKYFRKTRDANKKRSSDSKTCPYFHQLSSFYNQGKLTLHSEEPENHSSSPENLPEPPVTSNFRSPEWDEKNSGQVPALEFDYE